MRQLTISLVCLLVGSLVTQGQGLPPCGERPHTIDQPWVDGNLFCLEEVINDTSAGELAFTALASAPDDTLYAARPLAGQVLALNDTDGDGLPETPHVVADGLTLPNGLVFHDGTLYISGGSYIYHLVGNRVEILVDDLPSGSNGFWTGGLTVGSDERLYVATGAECDFCEPDDPLRGAVLSYSLDGSDQQVVATGLRQPLDLAFMKDTLWTIDTARDNLFDTPDLDELNRVIPGAHFGFPYCIGRNNHVDLPSNNFDCANADAPALTFPTHSTPMGLVAYTSDILPSLQGELLAVLNGSYNQAELHGFALVAIAFTDDGTITGYNILIPNRPDETTEPNKTWQDIQYSGAGFWPRRPLDVTVSTEGWVYISVSGGEILALRPR